MPFSKTSRPGLPGSFVNWVAAVATQVAPSIGSIVAVPFTTDWGPFKTVVQLDSLSDYKSIFGASETTPGFIAVKQAFQGSGVNGEGGAGTVLAYRTGGSAAAKATRVLQNVSTATALTLTTKYEGSRGNNLRITVQNNAADATFDQLILFDGTVELERYTYLDTDIAGLAAQINLSSGFVTAVANATGAALTLVSAVALTGGNDGTTLVSGDWTAVMSALEVYRFSIFAPYDLTDPSVLAALLAWAQNLNANSKRFMTIVGGALDESITTAVSRASSLNDPNFMTVGVGGVVDDNLGVLSTSQFAPRIAGILAARGEGRSLTFARLAGVSLRNGATTAQMLTAVQNGVTVLARDSNAVAPVKVEKPVTTFTLKTDTTRPYKIYSTPKFLRTMQTFERELDEWADDNVVGLPVNDKLRRAVVEEVKGRLSAREAIGAIQSGSTAGVDQDPPPSDDDEFVAVVIGMRFGRSAEQIFFTANVG